MTNWIWSISNWLSPFNDVQQFSMTEKLVHYVKLDMVIDEVTETLSFDQNNWLAPYIALNTKLSKKAEQFGKWQDYGERSKVSSFKKVSQ